MKTTIADRVSFLISNLGIMQRDFARRINYTQGYVCMVLSGAKPSPGPRFIEAVCREFKVNSGWLTSGKGEVFIIPGAPLPPVKAEILAKFQLLPPEKQKVVEEIIDGFLVNAMTNEENEKKQPEAKKKRAKKN